MDFDLYPADSIEITGVSSSSLLHYSTPVSSIWDNYKNCYNTDTSLSSLPDDILEVAPQARADCHSPWITLSEAAIVNLGNSKPWNFNAIIYAISSPIKSQEDWILSGPDTPLLYPSSIPIELVDPELRDILPSSISNLLITADSVKDTYGSIPITIPGYLESSVIQPLCNSQPVAIDTERGI
jgi:hypothetical protein